MITSFVNFFFFFSTSSASHSSQRRTVVKEIPRDLRYDPTDRRNHVSKRVTSTHYQKHFHLFQKSYLRTIFRKWRFVVGTTWPATIYGFANSRRYFFNDAISVARVIMTYDLPSPTKSVLARVVLSSTAKAKTRKRASLRDARNVNDAP